MDQRRHLPGLDGVRGVAIALVVIGHIGLLPRQTVAGGAGLAVFLVPPATQSSRCYGVAATGAVGGRPRLVSCPR